MGESRKILEYLKLWCMSGLCRRSLMTNLQKNKLFIVFVEFQTPGQKAQFKEEPDKKEVKKISLLLSMLAFLRLMLLSLVFWSLRAYLALRNSLCGIREREKTLLRELVLVKATRGMFSPLLSWFLKLKWASLLDGSGRFAVFSLCLSCRGALLGRERFEALIFGLGFFVCVFLLCPSSRKQDEEYMSVCFLGSQHTE